MFNRRWVHDFLAGSYKRETAIRPRRTEDGIDRADVDIIVVTNLQEHDTPDNVLRFLANILGDEFTVERINKRSVRINLPNAEIDVVPVINADIGYKLPDRDLGSWKYTNPPAHTTWSSEQNQRFDGRFKPLVKLFKWWKRHSNTPKRPKGFVLEVLVAENAPVNISHYGEAFTQMLEGIYRKYGSLAAQGIKPIIYDPGLPGSDILSKVSISDWKAFIEKISIHAGYARQAQTDANVEYATELWRRLFGPRFKSTQASARASSLATYATAPTVANSYIFPDKPVTAGKPRGFA
jgi:hypothetical protein